MKKLQPSKLVHTLASLKVILGLGLFAAGNTVVHAAPLPALLQSNPSVSTPNTQNNAPKKFSELNDITPNAGDESFSDTDSDLDPS